MEKTYSCLKCSWNVTTTKDLDLKCPKCGASLQVEITDEEDNAVSQIERIELKIMKALIEKGGNDNTWDYIEHIKDISIRLSDRKLFIKAGGVVPKNFEIKT